MSMTIPMWVGRLGGKFAKKFVKQMFGSMSHINKQGIVKEAVRDVFLGWQFVFIGTLNEIIKYTCTNIR